MDFLEKIRALPEPKRKIIFWLALISISLSLLFFWAKRAKVQLERFKGEEIKKHITPPSFEEIEFPKIEIEEELRKLEGLMKEESK